MSIGSCAWKLRRPSNPSPGGPLSLLRHCVLSLHRALFETYPRLSNLNLEQFWSSREVRILSEQFLSQKFGESWSNKEKVNRAYVALKAWRIGYIADVRRAVPEHGESEHPNGGIVDLSESSITPDEPLGKNPFPKSDSRHEEWVSFSREVTESLESLAVTARVRAVPADPFAPNQAVDRGALALARFDSLADQARKRFFQGLGDIGLWKQIRL
jgi:hypothetical protein